MRTDPPQHIQAAKDSWLSGESLSENPDDMRVYAAATKDWVPVKDINAYLDTRPKGQCASKPSQPIGYLAEYNEPISESTMQEEPKQIRLVVNNS
jgi:hypothetical protein